MRPASVPLIDLRYWVLISLASVFGANLGDFCSHVLHLGHVRGLPILLVLLLLVLWGERRGGAAAQGWYWAAIVLLRTAATNLADLADHDLRMPVGWVTAALEGLMVLFCLPRSLRPAALPPRGVARRPVVDGWYWATMLTAGTLGTALGDFTADGIGLGTGLGTVALGAVLGAVLLLGAPVAWAGAAYWIGVVAVRCAGTTAGDFVVGHEGLGLGLPVATACSGLLFVGALVLWRPGRVVVAAE